MTSKKLPRNIKPQSVSSNSTPKPKTPFWAFVVALIISLAPVYYGSYKDRETKEREIYLDRAFPILQEAMEVMNDMNSTLCFKEGELPPVRPDQPHEFDMEQARDVMGKLYLVDKDGTLINSYLNALGVHPRNNKNHSRGRDENLTIQAMQDFRISARNQLNLDRIDPAIVDSISRDNRLFITSLHEGEETPCEIK